MKLSTLLSCAFGTGALAVSLSAAADIGTLAAYDGPYTPNPCNISYDDVTQKFGYQVVVVSDGLWDNGAACERHYLVRCISGPTKNKPSACTGNSINAIVIGYCPSCRGAAMKIARPAYGLLAKNAKQAFINVEYQQY